jgi:membrane-bound serine protease (ClpP class)
MFAGSLPLHRLIPPRRFRFTVIVALLFAGTLVACAPSIDERDAVHILTADAEVNPVLERYIDRGIDEAERTDARAVVIKLDTPGGLSTSMEGIIQRIQASRVPVIVYVSPAGAKAASAGTFITMSAHVAAMAPGTTIGAAHPVSATGGDIEGDLGRKIENNAAAYARAIAEDRGRNADWAEDAVRRSISAPTSEAVELNVVDFAATSVDDLLEKSEGRTVNVAGEERVLADLSEAVQATNNMTFIERVLLLLSDPNIAFLLLSLGGLGLLIELLNPGLMVPGIFGSIALILAFLAIGTLPINWAGVALIVLAFALFAAEVFVSGFGALGIGGAVALIAGGMLLTTTDNPDFQVSRWLVVATGVICAGFFLMVMTAIIKARRMPPALGAAAMVGSAAVARSPLDPEGFVFLRGERWHAVADDAPVSEGETVEVTEVKGLTLHVRRRDEPAESTPDPAT